MSFMSRLLRLVPVSIKTRLVVGLVACVGVVFGAGVSSALAAGEAPGWEVMGHFGPTVLAPGGEGELVLNVYNTGAAAGGEGTLVDALPPGLKATGGPNCTGETTVECTVGSPAPGTGHPYTISIPVSVAADASGEGIDRVTVSGGGATNVADASVPVKFGDTPAGPGFSSFDAWFTNADGTVDTQAGSHPYEVTVAFSSNSEVKDGSILPVGETRDLEFKMPPGVIGNPNVVPQCPRWRFDEGELGEEVGKGCQASSKIGFDYPEIAGVPGQLPVYNMVPPPGVAAEFAFTLDGVSTFLDARVRSGGNYGITEHINNVARRQILFNTITIWGNPSEVGHDVSRAGPECLEDGKGGCGFRGPQVPFLTLPTSCQGPQPIFAEMLGTWAEPEAKAGAEVKTHDSEGAEVGFTGCKRLLHFEPSASLAPDTSFADTPAGLTADVKVPQGVNPEALNTSGLKNTTVTLPEGIAINPGQATGLVACQPAQENIGGPEAEQEGKDGPPECPAASKVGTDEITTPLLPDKLVGDVYILQQNPPNLQLLVAASADGVNLKLIGKVHLNEVTGRITTTFEKTPDFPFTDFKLAFSGGAQAALSTPTGCGIYESTADFTPWAGLENGIEVLEDALSTSRFAIDHGPLGSACASPLPFAPSLTAGSTTDQAGGYSSFSLLLQSGDDQQRISKLQFKAPAGLSGMISKVPLCGEAQANAGTCSAASQIGHTVVAAGPGPYPLVVPEAGQPPAAIYLTEKYQGAPFGLSIVVPVVAGPFTLETQVVRAKIEVDPHTAQITVTTNPFPQMIAGIPTDLRTIDAVIDRPGFIFNPTNCAPQSFSGTASSVQGTQAAISSPFQMGSCQSLQFKPDFKVSTQGRASKAQGASLTAEIVYPTGPLGSNQASSQSNIASVKVDLPKQLPSRLTTLQKACTSAQFEANPAGCPAASVVGRARVITPILPVPLEGPAFFVSHGGEAFPSLEVMLQGYGVTVELVGSTFISKAGITSSTFKSTPDVPFSSFELTLPRGKYSALTANVPAKANYSLCGQKLVMPTAFTAQDGAVIHQSTPITVSGCPKTKAAKKPKKKKAKAKKSSVPNGKGRE